MPVHFGHELGSEGGTVADEVADKFGGCLVVDALRCAHLLHDTLVEDGHPVAHGQGLVLVVGHVDRGDPELALQVLELLAQLVPEFRVQVGQRLVEEQDLGLQHQGAGDCHALLLAARKLGHVLAQLVIG